MTVSRLLYRTVCVLSVIGAMSTTNRPSSLSGQALLRLEEYWRVGALEGTDLEIFGRISDIRASDQGGVVVADNSTSLVKVFSEGGELLAASGRRGQGPGEFGHIGAVSVTGDSTVRVLDNLNARIVRLRLQDGGLELAGDAGLKLDANNMCTIGDRVFLLSYREQGIIQEIDDTGVIVRSFGDPFLDSSPYVARLSTDGEMLCLEEEGDVVVFPEDVPEIVAYSASGELRWRTRVEGFKAQRYIPEGPGVVAYADPQEGGRPDKAISLVDLGSGLLLAQFGTFYVGAQGLEDITRVESRVYSAADGKEVARSKELRRIDASAPIAGLVFAQRNLPFPQLIAFRYSIARE